MIDWIKKQWFVVLVGILFLFASVYFAFDQTKGILAGKRVAGQDVVFEINGQNVTADELYEKLYEEMGISAFYTLFERAVVSQSATADKDLLSEAKIEVNLTIEYFKQSYGPNYESVLLQAIRGIGYSKLSDLEVYFTHILLLEKLTEDYFVTNSDKYYEDFFKLRKPRLVSHILVVMDDPDNPTEEENRRWNLAKAAIEGGLSIADAAKQFSEDPGSKDLKGSIGYVDSTSRLVPEFLKAALELDQNEVSQWIKTTYGWHLITVDSTDPVNLEKEELFFSALKSFYPKAKNEMIWSLAQELSLDFKDNPQIRTQLLSWMGIQEDQ